VSRLFEHFGDPDANRGAGWLVLIAHAMMPATIALAAVDFARMVVPWLVPQPGVHLRVTVARPLHDRRTPS